MILSPWWASWGSVRSECSGAECSKAVMESDVGGVPGSGVLDGRVIEARVWVSDGELRMAPVGSAGNVCEVDLIR